MSRWDAFTPAERNYLRGALESFDAPPALNGVTDLEAELAALPCENDVTHDIIKFN